MKFIVLLTVLVFASKRENDAEGVAANSREKIVEDVAENSVVVKIEEEEYDTKKSKSSKYFGVAYYDKSKKWSSQRWSKAEKKIFKNGYHKDEETAAHASDTLARKLMANGEQNHKLNFSDDSTEVYPEKKKTSKFIGVHYQEKTYRWIAQRWSKKEQKIFTNGANHGDERTAAHASDSLAKKLMMDGEQNLKLNFPNDNTEVHSEEKTKSSTYIGVSHIEKHEKWQAQRWSKIEKRTLVIGQYKCEEKAAHASDTLARKLIAKGEEGHKINFPDDNTDVNPEKRNFKYIGVYYLEKSKKWTAQRWSKTQKRIVKIGYYKDEETAAYASDILAKRLVANDEQNHKLNFPEDSTEQQFEQQTNKRKRHFDFEYSHPNKNSFKKFEEKEK